MSGYAARARTRKNFAPEPAAALRRPAHAESGGARWNLSHVPALPAGVQAKLVVGAVNDPAEAEADRIADQVMSGADQAAAPAVPAAASGPAAQRACSSCGDDDHVQRLPIVRRADAGAASAGAVGAGGGPAGPAAESAVRGLGAGAPLAAPDRAFFESRFDRDFTDVRIHDGAAGDRASRAMAARAFTLGSDIAFAGGEYRPGTGEGRHLLAHELTHVVQQSAGVARRAPKKGKGGGEPKAATPAKSKAAAPAKPKVPQICKRDSRKVAGNWITKVNLDVGANTLSMEWNDPSTAPAGTTGKTFPISPGAGLCCVDCNDDTVSQTADTLCTPKGGTWKVFNNSKCHLDGHTGAKNPTYFQRAGIAIHSGTLLAPPKSHGCARTKVDISEIIHDNSVVDTTEIASSGTWAGPQCYKNAKTDTLSSRADVCDGDKLKPEPKPKAKKAKTPAKAKAPAGKAPGGGKKATKKKGKTAANEFAPTENEALLALGAADDGPDDALFAAGSEDEAQWPTDGPGPNNEPAEEGDLPPVAEAQSEEGDPLAAAPPDESEEAAAPEGAPAPAGPEADIMNA